jgi:hypothetical protein
LQDAESEFGGVQGCRGRAREGVLKALGARGFLFGRAFWKGHCGYDAFVGTFVRRSRFEQLGAQGVGPGGELARIASAIGVCRILARDLGDHCD